ncbi:MAG TPA: hypothetical protein VNM40_03000 [Candidatus Paceibacterota bacterium]|nr:hypothetical protein [Candidatus Paceibacterota bacterium]
MVFGIFRRAERGTQTDIEREAQQAVRNVARFEALVRRIRSMAHEKDPRAKEYIDALIDASDKYHEEVWKSSGSIGHPFHGNSQAMDAAYEDRKAFLRQFRSEVYGAFGEHGLRVVE